MLSQSNGQDYDAPLAQRKRPPRFPRTAPQTMGGTAPKAAPETKNFSELLEAFRKEAEARLETLIAETKSKSQAISALGEAAGAQSPFVAERPAGPVQFILKLLEVWNLDKADARPMLGFEQGDEAIVEGILAGRGSLRGVDSKDRVALLIRIRALLADMHQNVEAERAWLRIPRAELGNRSPLDLLRQGSMESLLTLRQFVERVSGL